MKSLLTSLLFLGFIWTFVSCDNSQLPGGQEQTVVNTETEYVAAMQNLFREHNIELSNTDLEKLERISKIAGRHLSEYEQSFGNLDEQQLRLTKAMLLMDEEDIDLIHQFIAAQMNIDLAMNEKSNKLAEKWHPLIQEAIDADDVEEINRLRKLHEQERRELNQALNDSLGLSDEKIQRFQEITQNYVAPMMDLE